MRFALPLIALAAVVPTAFAHCPLCTAAVGTGAIVSRFLGLDDTVFGLWVGALVVSSTIAATKRWKEVIPHQRAMLSAMAIILTVYGLKLGGVLGDLRYMVFGVDKMVIGMVVGGIVTYIMPRISLLLTLRLKRGIPYQTIVLTVVALTALSVLAQVGATMLLTGS